MPCRLGRQDRKQGRATPTVAAILIPGQHWTRRTRGGRRRFTAGPRPRPSGRRANAWVSTVSSGRQRPGQASASKRQQARDIADPTLYCVDSTAGRGGVRPVRVIRAGGLRKRDRPPGRDAIPLRLQAGRAGPAGLARPAGPRHRADCPSRCTQQGRTPAAPRRIFMAPSLAATGGQ